jgi:hypothetical protein
MRLTKTAFIEGFDGKGALSGLEMSVTRVERVPTVRLRDLTDAGF